jgi:hypothetical protein
MKAQLVDTWTTTIDDKPGALARKLKALAEGGVNLEFIVARRAEPGKTLVFVTPIEGGDQIATAGEAGFHRSSKLHTVRVEGADKPGAGAAIMQALADQGLNLRGVSAAAIGNKFVCHIAVDTEADATRAEGILKSL